MERRRKLLSRRQCTTFKHHVKRSRQGSLFWNSKINRTYNKFYSHPLLETMPATAWMMAVKEAHAKLKKKNPKATLSDAMKEAKKTYKKK